MEGGNIETIPSFKLNTNTYVGKNNISFVRKYSKPVIDELTTQLLACRQLLALEPDNKCKKYLSYFLYGEYFEN